ncbi:hypothetical protein K437DRAFT_264429 [Tilletiaria anomala UBC 951]|uniref:Uncharacterized protein n=1 Tax=Tilletiaria anomala (strain ATCC 24038 / CBS 436.72 / UBC 951) TaxID=1037660 RepID=A0A066VEQ8_TILAU|nr:uncharacterized protein K437DRAFT_264429 [Tilletiaria anomala UBC 951]KDN39921.1 hypothetical protein K437DRAFT_264429 [Tilletiaria anomala UBC 951]
MSSRVSTCQLGFPGTKLNYAENILFPLYSGNSTACEPSAQRTMYPPGAESLLRFLEDYGTADAAIGRHPHPNSHRNATMTVKSSVSLVIFLAVGAFFSGLATDAGHELTYGRLDQMHRRLVLMDERVEYAGKAIQLCQGVAEQCLASLDPPVPPNTPLPFRTPASIVFPSQTMSEPKCITPTHRSLLLVQENSKLFIERVQSGEGSAQITTRN